MREYAERMAPHRGEFVEGTGETVSETVLSDEELRALSFAGGGGGAVAD